MDGNATGSIIYQKKSLHPDRAESLSSEFIRMKLGEMGEKTISMKGAIFRLEFDDSKNKVCSIMCHKKVAKYCTPQQKVPLGHKLHSRWLIQKSLRKKPVVVLLYTVQVEEILLIPRHEQSQLSLTTG